jgi:hypothetical protein
MRTIFSPLLIGEHDGAEHEPLLLSVPGLAMRNLQIPAPVSHHMRIPRCLHLTLTRSLRTFARPTQAFEMLAGERRFWRME